SVYFVSGHSLVFSHGTAMSVIYTLSLHDALPIFRQFTVNDGIERSDLLVDLRAVEVDQFVNLFRRPGIGTADHRDDRSQPLVQADRKSTRLNSSHVKISYAVFCLKKKRVHSI